MAQLLGVRSKNDGNTTYARFKGVSNKEKEANKKGKPEGLYKEYYESGALKTETNFKNGIYELVVSFQGQNIPIYVTSDGENLIQGVALLMIWLLRHNS